MPRSVTTPVMCVVRISGPTILMTNVLQAHEVGQQQHREGTANGVRQPSVMAPPGQTAA